MGNTSYQLSYSALGGLIAFICRIVCISSVGIQGI